MGDSEGRSIPRGTILVGDGVEVRFQGLAHFRMKEGPYQWGCAVVGMVPVGTVLREKE